MADTNNTHETLESLGALKYKALQALAKNRGIKANLSKGKLIQELLSASAQQQVCLVLLALVDSIPQIPDTRYCFPVHDSAWASRAVRV